MKERKYLGEEYRIHCSNPEEARKVVDIYYSLGYTWLIESQAETHFGKGPNVVYSTDNNLWIKYGCLSIAKNLNKKIVSAKEFISYYTN